jgi:hypothetical protein
VVGGAEVAFEPDDLEAGGHERWERLCEEIGEMAEEERRRWEGGRRKRLRLRWGGDGGWGVDAGE